MKTKARIVVRPSGTKDLEIQTLALPEPGPYEVAIALQASGICHTQLDHINLMTPARPIVLGHEAVGEVIGIGSEVTHVAPGDVVFVTWLPRNGSRTPRAASLEVADGQLAQTLNVYTWATHCVSDEQYVVKAPADMPADLASIIGCAVMTGAGAVLNTVKVAAGMSAAVWGAGGVGLPAITAAHNVGAFPVIAVDVSEDKLRLASLMGADCVVNAREVDPVATIRELTRHDDGTAGADVSFDCTGRADNIAKSVAATRPGLPGVRAGGTDVLVGIVRSTFELPGLDLIAGQQTLTGSMGGGCSPERDFPIFTEWYASGKLDLSALVTNRYSLDQIGDGVRDLSQGRVPGRAVIVV